MRTCFSNLRYSSLSLYIFGADRLAAVHSTSDRLLPKFSQAKVVSRGKGIPAGKDSARQLRLEEMDNSLSKVSGGGIIIFPDQGFALSLSGRICM